MGILQYPPNIDGKTFITFIAIGQKQATDNASNQKGGGQTTQKGIHESPDVRIALYHPEMIHSNTTIDWEVQDTGKLGTAVKTYKNIDVDNPGAAITNVMSTLKDAISDGALAGSLRNIVDKANGKIYNPNKDIFFKGVGFREFQFTFNFAPESLASAQSVRDIIVAFKRYSHPTLNGSYLTYPPRWKIESRVNNKTLMKYKPCYITSVNVDYAPNQVVANFENGMPVNIKMEIGFKESEIITSSDYVGVTDGYGY